MSEFEKTESSSLRAWPFVALGFGLAIGLGVQMVFEAEWSLAWEFGVVQALLIGGLAFVLCAAPERLRWPAIFSLGLAGLLLLASVTAILRFGTTAADYSNIVTESLTVGSVLFALLALTFFQTWQSVSRESARGDAVAVPSDPNAAYDRFFGHIWENVLLAGISFCFLGLFWILLFLFSELFDSVGISALKDLIEEPFFAWPASCGAIAVAVAFTRELDRILAALRSIVFGLFTVLTPVFLALSVVFVVALAFGGFERLSSLVSASTTLIVLACFGIVFVNAVIRDGGGAPAASLAQVSAMALLPCLALFCGFAVYAIGLRIEQHGLTPERIFVACTTGVLTAWSLAYLACLFGRRRWMVYCRYVNLAVAVFVAVLVASLQSPIADPYRLSAENQLRRLLDGTADPSRFDYGFLKFRLGSAGQTALQRLAEDSGEADPDIVARNLAALAKVTGPHGGQEFRDGARLQRMMEALADPDRVQRLPPTLEVPDDISASALAGSRYQLVRCGTAKLECLIFSFDLTDGPGPELLIASRESDRLVSIIVLEKLPAAAGWRSQTLSSTHNVDRLWASLLARDLEAVPTLHRDLRIGSDVIRFHKPNWSAGK